MRRSDKSALALAVVLGAFMLAITILGALGGALAPDGASIMVQMWLRLCLIIILPLWLLMRAIGAIFASPKDEPFTARHSAHWGEE